MPSINDDEFTITVTHRAIDTITAMRDELARIQELFGDSDPRTVKAATTLAFSLTQLLMLRPTDLWSDGALDLGARNSFLRVGLNYTGASYNEHHVGEWSVNS